MAGTEASKRRKGIAATPTIARMKTIILLLAVIGLSGCSALQAFGEASRDLQQWERENGSLSAAPKIPIESDRAPRNQVAPVNIRQPTAQYKPIGPDQVVDDKYYWVSVDTPNGRVHKRCKMLNGKAVHCI